MTPLQVAARGKTGYRFSKPCATPCPLSCFASASGTALRLGAGISAGWLRCWVGTDMGLSGEAWVICALPLEYRLMRDCWRVKSTEDFLFPVNKNRGPKLSAPRANAHQTDLVVRPCALLVLSIDCRRHEAQVFNPVIVPLAILVINYAVRPIAIEQKPSPVMCSALMICGANHSIAVRLHATGDLAAQSLWSANAMRQGATRRAVDKMYRRSLKIWSSHSFPLQHLSQHPHKGGYAEGGDDVGERGHLGCARFCGHPGRALRADQFRPDDEPVIGAHLPALELVARCNLHGGAFVSGDAARAPIAELIWFTWHQRRKVFEAATCVDCLVQSFHIHTEYTRFVCSCVFFWICRESLQTKCVTQAVSI